MPGKKRMIAVPLVALMVCAVACVGVAYAYTSTITNSGDSADVDYFTVDLYKTDGITLINGQFSITEAKLVATTATTIEANKTVVVTVDKVNEEPVYVFGFEVSAEDETTYTIPTKTAILTVDTTGISSLVPAPTVTTPLAVTGAIGGVYSDAACTTPVESGYVTGTMYYISVVFGSITPGVYTYLNATTTAASLADAIEGAITINFGITIGVESAA